MPLQLPLLTLCIPHLTYQAVTLPPSTWHTPVQSHSLTPLSAAPGHHKGVLCWPPSFPSSTGPYPLHYSRAGDPISSPPQHAAWPCCWLSSDTTGHGPANKWNSTRTSLNRTCQIRWIFESTNTCCSTPPLQPSHVWIPTCRRGAMLSQVPTVSFVNSGAAIQNN